MQRSQIYQKIWSNSIGYQLYPLSIVQKHSSVGSLLLGPRVSKMASCCGQVWRFQYNVNHMFPLFYRQNHFHKINVYIFHRTKDAELVIRWVHKTYLFVSQNATSFWISPETYITKYKSEKLPRKAATMNGKPLGPEWKLEHGDEKGARTKIQKMLVIE